jgi:predicted RNA binding protein YcfA (HicA-like mRNA interferase family)
LAFEQIAGSLWSRPLQRLARTGYQVDHQTGGHIILRNENPPHRRITVPNHKEIAKGTLRSILRQAGMTIEELISFL